ncbi:MAG TPA: hypothetical protein VJZ25_06395 [Gemmatimonadaceae bacterium]|nr:hypothetical protein [Gemmatimonadaceae bacterium]
MKDDRDLDFPLAAKVFLGLICFVAVGGAAGVYALIAWWLG